MRDGWFEGCGFVVCGVGGAIGCEEYEVSV